MARTIFHEFLRLAAPQYEHATYVDPFWRLATSGIWTVTPAPHDQPASAQALRENGTVASPAAEVAAALTEEPALIGEAMAELVDLYVSCVQGRGV